MENRISQYLSTEHFTLQGGRSNLISEMNGRITAFLTAVSGGVVGLALVAQVTGMNQAFFIFSVILFPILITIGFSTYLRVTALTIADYVYIVAINRIHHFYLEAAPEIAPFLTFPGYDDNYSVDRARIDLLSYRLTQFSSAPGLVMAINCLLAGLFGCILVITLMKPVWSAIIAIGVFAFMTMFFVQVKAGARMEATARDRHPMRFPNPENIQPENE